MKIIVTGGRDYKNRELVYKALNKLAPTLVVQGGATGADTLALDWAVETGCPHRTYEVTDQDWEKFGKAAGPLRNGQMLVEHADAIVVAFPGGRGTADCVKQALALKRLVLQVLE